MAWRHWRLFHHDSHPLFRIARSAWLLTRGPDSSTDGIRSYPLRYYARCLHMWVLESERHFRWLVPARRSLASQSGGVSHA